MRNSFCNCRLYCLRCLVCWWFPVNALSLRPFLKIRSPPIPQNPRAWIKAKLLGIINFKMPKWLLTPIFIIPADIVRSAMKNHQFRAETPIWSTGATINGYAAVIPSHTRSISIRLTLHRQKKKEKECPRIFRWKTANWPVSHAMIFIGNAKNDCLKEIHCAAHPIRDVWVSAIIVMSRRITNQTIPIISWTNIMRSS